MKMRRILIDLDVLEVHTPYTSAEIITVERLSEKMQKAKIDFEILSKDLRNKKVQILEFLSESKLKPVEVVLPNEI